MTASAALVAPPVAGPAPAAAWTGHLSILLVWSIWATMTLALLALVWRYGSNVPLWDEWDMVPTLTGHQPVTLRWLWSQHNEHRVPLPRLILLAVDGAAGKDLRAAMYFNVGVMSALAAACLLVLRRLRGRNTFADAAVPLVLLNWGHAVNFIWGWQVQFFASTALAIVALLIIASGRYGSRELSAIGLCTVLLGLCGANGVALVPALAVWLGGVGFVRWRSGSSAEAIIVTAAAATGLLISALYFVGYEAVPYHSKPREAASAVISASRFVAMAWGPVAPRTWPFIGWFTVALILLCLVLTARAWKANPTERVRAAGLLAFFGAMLSLAVGLGMGRDGFEPRYVTLAVPLVLAVVVGLTLYAPLRAGAAVQLLLLAASAGAIWPNTTVGLTYARAVRGQLATFERQLAGGVPTHKLIVRFGEWLHPHDDVIAHYLPMLQTGGSERYCRLAADPPMRAIHVPLTPAAVHDAAWDDATATATVSADYAHIDFELPAPVHAAGVRLRYTLRNSDGAAPYISVAWRNPGDEHFQPGNSRKYSATGDRETWGRWTVARPADGERTLTVWVDQPVSHLRLIPDLRPCEMTIHELTVLSPAGAVVGGAPSPTSRP